MNLRDTDVSKIKIKKNIRMMMKMLDFSKKRLEKILNLAGIEIHRKRQVRASMHGCLQQAVKNGLRPNTILDVGVAYGTQALYELFPDARHILIEPLEEFVPHLDNLVAKLNKFHFYATREQRCEQNKRLNKR